MGLTPPLQSEALVTQNQSNNSGEVNFSHSQNPSFDAPIDSPFLVQDSANILSNFLPNLSPEFPPSVAMALHRTLLYLRSDSLNADAAVDITLDASKEVQTQNRVLPAKSSDKLLWLGARVKDFIFEEENLLSSVHILKHGVAFPFSNSEVRILNGSLSASASPMDSSASVLASNVGALVYQQSKQRSELWSVMFDQLREVIFNSPRIGILSIGRGLFSSRRRIDFINSEAQSNRIFEASVLFHEARHGDGHGAHLGMPHAICPVEHELSGLTACDDVSNGAYKVSAEFIQEAMSSCVSCSESDRQALLMVEADQLNRITSRKGNLWIDDRAEKISD